MYAHSKRAAAACCLFIWLTSIAGFANGQQLDGRLVGSFPQTGGPITISTTADPIVTSGLVFDLSSGAITIGDSPAPYDTVRQERDRTEFGFNRVVLSGSVTLDAVASADAVVKASWRQPFDDGIGARSFSFPFLGGEAARFAIKGSYAYDGGPISIEPVIANLPVNVRKLDFTAKVGTLNSTGNAAPFSSLDANSDTQWTASSQADVLIDGPVTLDVSYTTPVSATSFQLFTGLESKVSDATDSSTFDVTRRAPESTNQISGSYSKQGPLVVESTGGPVSVRGLEFVSQLGDILGGTDPAPFQTVEANQRDRWTVRSDVDVTLDGQLQLDATVGQFTTVTGYAWDGSVSKQFDMTRRPQLDVEVSYPFDGGPLSISGPAWTNDQPSITTVDIRATAGQLSNGTDPAPFQTITNNSIDRWSAGTETPIALPTGDEAPISLDVVASIETAGTVVVSNGPDSLTVDLQRAAPIESKSLIGGYSFTDGGPVSLASNKPISLRNLKIDANPDYGKLIGGENAAPFESVTTNSDTTWAVESSSNVTIDGIVELDLQVEPGTFLDGQAFDGTATSKVVFNGITNTSSFNWFVGAYPEEGGKMLLLAPNGPIDSRGVAFDAEPGVLTIGDDPSPYTFFIPNSLASGNVTLATLGTSALIDGIVELDVTVAANTPEGSIGAQGANPQPDVASVAPHATTVFMMPSLEKFAAGVTTCVIPADELVGDLDDNGTVEFRDFLILAKNFGLEVDTYAEGDMNCNGTVDFEDFLSLGNHFGESRTAAAQPVPEPAAVALVAFGLLALAKTRRRRR